MDNGRLAKNYDREMFSSGVSVCRAVVVFRGRISVGPNEIHRDHMATNQIQQFRLNSYVC